MDETMIPQNKTTDAIPPAQPVGMQEPPKKVGKFKASLIIAKESWNLLKKDKEMMAFPILSLIASVVLMGIIGIIFFFAILGGSFNNVKALENSSYLVEVILAFIMYFATTFITIFFETGIITIIHGRLNGQDLTFNDGLKNSFNKIGKIAEWSLVSATVGLILKMISDRSRILGRIVVAILGAAWSILTFFIAPILIIEDLSLKDSLKKSAAIIKRSWGETVIINVGAGLFFMMLILIGLFVFIASLFTANITIIIAVGVLFFIYIIILAIISSTLNAIFKMVLYEYANTGTIPLGFSEDVLKAAFKEKKKTGIIGIGGM